MVKRQNGQTRQKCLDSYRKEVLSYPFEFISACKLLFIKKAQLSIFRDSRPKPFEKEENESGVLSANAAKKAKKTEMLEKRKAKSFKL